MLPVIPWYFAVVVVTMSIALVIAVWTIFSATAGRGFRLGLAVFLGVWLVAALIAAPSRASLLVPRDFPITPVIPVFAIVSALIAIVAFALSPAVRRALASASLPAVHGIHVFRLAGFTMIALLAQGQLPAHFAVPAGWGDVFIGATALPVAYALARSLPGSRAVAMAWNVLGLIDLVTAIGTGTGVFVHARPAAAMGIFPMVLIPTLAVPLAMILHVIGLSRLLASQPSAESVRRPASLAS